MLAQPAECAHTSDGAEVKNATKVGVRRVENKSMPKKRKRAGNSGMKENGGGVRA